VQVNALGGYTPEKFKSIVAARVQLLENVVPLMGCTILMRILLDEIVTVTLLVAFDPGHVELEAYSTQVILSPRLKLPGARLLPYIPSETLLLNHSNERLDTFSVSPSKSEKTPAEQTRVELALFEEGAIDGGVKLAG
jgi:hypothetical protein